MDKIAVIIVTFNGEKWIKKCIESVLKSSVSPMIFVVDNASTDGTIDILAQFENLQTISLHENCGFGKANNIAIQKTLSLGFTSFFLLNQDTWVEENTIEKLSFQQKNMAKFGILSPMHFSSSGEKLDENFANYYAKKQFVSENLFEVSFVNAAAWLVSKVCFEKIGLFEPLFSHYGEDRNFCDRAHYHGFKVGVVADAKIVHDRSIIRNFNKDLQQSKYLILNTLININFSFFKSFVIAFKQVVGLPKYFFQSYGFKKSLVLLLLLSNYLLKNLVNYQKTYSIRAKSKLGKNGF